MPQKPLLIGEFPRSVAVRPKRAPHISQENIPAYSVTCNFLKDTKNRPDVEHLKAGSADQSAHFAALSVLAAVHAVFEPTKLALPQAAGLRATIESIS